MGAIYGKSARKRSEWIQLTISLENKALAAEILKVYFYYSLKCQVSHKSEWNLS